MKQQTLYEECPLCNQGSVVFDNDAAGAAKNIEFISNSASTAAANWPSRG